MSEWISVLAVFWVLWAWDALRILPRRFVHATGGWRAGRARLSFGRVVVVGISPGNWRAATPDLPFSFSPDGICNRPVGCAGRPAETPEQAVVWRWNEVSQVGVSEGWLFINGRRFCPDTGHLGGPALLELVRLDAGARERRIEVLLRLWLRPAHLRRRARVVVERTANAAILNTFLLVFAAAVSVYVVIEGAARLPTEVSAAVARALPMVLLYMLGLHVGGIVTAWLALRRLKARRPARGGSTLLGALFFPPQALRLRAMLAEGFFPPQHPLALALAFGREEERAQWGFQTLADLRWPIHGRNDPEFARQVTSWFGAALERRLIPVLKRAQLSPQLLLAAPLPDAPASQGYCPRCRAQFVAGWKECPHQVPLVPLAGSGENSSGRSRPKRKR